VSGHSKFSNIKHRKERNDAAKGKVFTRLGREIATAVKQGGADVSLNSRLKDIVAKARANNMPNDTIERSIKKAAGDLTGVSYESVIYEGYGPSGVAVIVEVLTDNRNRAAANVRNAFTKGGGNMGTSGCVSFLFEEKGVIIIDQDGRDEDEITMIAIEAGAEDITPTDDSFEIVTAPEDFSAVREAFEKNEISLSFADVAKIPLTKAALTGPDDIKKMNKLLDLLDDEDDVINVYHNLETE